MVKTQLALVVALMALSVMPVHADLAEEIATSSRQAIEQGRSMMGDDFIKQLIGKHESAQVDGFVGVIPELSSPLHSNDETYVILVSSNMGDSALRQLFDSLSHRNDVQFVIRGLLPTEKTITDATKRIYHLVKDMEPVPNVTLDPRYFKEVKAELAPQILMYRGNDLVLTAVGLANPTYMQEQYEQGKRGDLGKFGNTVSINEKDLTEIVMERASKLDADQIKADAKNRYWDNVQFTSLPEATETRIREFVPILTVQKDIISPDNKLIAYSGQQYNSLEQLPFTQRLVIFDATNADHLAYVKALPKSAKRTKYITTRFDRSLKWDAVKTVERQLGASVYQLQSDVINAFDLRVIPTIVTADNQRKVFMIAETQLSEGGLQEAE